MKNDGLILFVLLLVIWNGSPAQSPVGEKNDRGVVALSISENEVYVGWRFLPEDTPETSFNVYRKDIPAVNKKTCLMQNRQYRLGVATSTMGYIYPPQLGIEKENATK